MVAEQSLGMDACKDPVPVPVPADADADADPTSCVGGHDPKQAVNVASSGENGHGDAVVEAQPKAPTHTDAAEVHQAAVNAGKMRSGEDDDDGDDDDDDDDVRAVAGDGGHMFVEYFVYGKPFQVLARYIPPFNPIGQGAYGFVCSAIDSETNEMVAIKKICNVFDSRVDAKRTFRELRLLRHLDHENVIAIKHIMPPADPRDFQDVYVVFPIMDTDLSQLIRSRQPLTEEHCQYFLYQILRGLKYIHSANVLHRDLKPDNILINANCDLRICDFGIARTMTSTDSSSFMTEYVVARWYRAPELLLNACEYTGAIDVWSVGCIYMELLTHQPLFPGRDYVHQLRSIVELIGLPNDSDLAFVKSENARRYLRQLPKYEKKPLQERYPSLSPLALDLVDKMLTFDATKRISVEDALAHPYLASLHDVSDEPVCHTPFTFDFDEQSLTQDELRDLIYKEALHFNH